MFKAVFDENVKEVFERFLKLHNSPQHHWFAMEDVFNSLIKLWDVCITTTRNFDLAFNLIDLRDILIKPLSIVHLVKNLLKLAQRRSHSSKLMSISILQTCYSRNWIQRPLLRSMIQLLFHLLVALRILKP
jgi:hypothetical protein